jgi:hypothetical protein
VARTRFAALVFAVAAGLVSAQTPPAAPPEKAPDAKASPPAATTPPAATRPATTTPMSPTAAPVPPGTDKAQFQLKLEKGKPFYQKLSTVVTQTIKVQGGADLPQKHEQTFYFKWLPVDQVADKWIVKQTIEGAKMTIDIAGNQVKYDSSTPAEGGAQPGLADFFAKIVGSEFTVTFGKGMAVEKVDGRDDFLKKLGGINNQMETILKKMLGEEALKQMVDPTFGLSPPTEQAVGGIWEKPTTMSLGPIGSYELKTKYTYKGKDVSGPNKDLDRIDVSVSVKYKAPAEQTEGLLFKIKSGELNSLDATPEQAARNFILYDAKLGRVVESSLVVKMKGTLNVTIGSTDTTIDLTQEQTTTVSTRDVTFLEPKK